METSRASILSSELPWPAAPTVLSGIHQNTLTNQSDQPCQQSLYLKTLTMPLYQLSQCGSYQAPFQFAAGGAGLTLDTSNMSVVLNPQPSTVIQKAPAQTLTLNIVNTLPIMSPNCSPSLTSVSPGKSKNVGKHICAHCGRDCLKPSVLEKHIRSHTGERPFPCTTCGIAFKTQSNLYKHRKTQTHVNNCKLSVDLDCSNCQEDKTDGRLGDNMSLCSTDNADVIVYTDEGETSGTDFSTQENNILSLGNEEVLPVCVKSLQSVQACSGKMHGDSDNPHTGIVSSSVLKQRRMLKDQRSPMASRQVQLQRQHATYVDKQWDSNPLERKLKKCESTDSGYLSHSDSVDFQFFTGSPLNSLSENSIESEHMTSTGALRPDESNAINMECVDKTTPSMEKRRLEEHISMLISQNKAVVDDRHLDNVRPRKTALSKQGSIDLPMPYTFKDSFHFDIRSLDANRKKVSLCSAKSIVTPHEKNKPLFFHSVPTQFSTTVDSIMVSRSNSLPFIESGRLPPDKVDVHSSKHHCLDKLPLDSSFANLLLNNNVASCTVDFSSSHPRSLVRQTAVDEMPLSTAADCYIQEEKNGKKNLTGEQQTPKGKTGSRKGSKKKINMFSHEKWQMYGDETFKKLYQKIQQNESMKKLKQEAAMSKSLVNNENPLLAANDTVNSSLASTPSGVNTNGSSGSSQANLSSQVASRSRDQELSQSMEAQLSTVHLQKSSGLVKAKCKSSSGIPESEISRLERKHQPLKKQPTNIDMSYLSPDIPQPALKYNYAPPAGCPDNLSVKVTDNHSKLPSISNIDHIGQVCSNNLLLTSEKSPSERKKFKGGELKDTQTLNSKDNINVESEYTCDNSLEPTPKTNVDGTSSLDSIVSGIEDRQLLHKENLTAPVTPCNNPEDASAHVLVQPQPAAASAKLDGNNLSQSHIVKLHRSEPYPEASAPLQSEKDDVSQVMLEEKVVESLNSMHSVPEKEDIDIIPGFQQADWQHYQGEITQVMQTHKSSVNSLLRNNMNAGPVPTCASVLSILEGQDKSQGTQGDNDHNVILDETDMTSHSKISKQVIIKPTSIDPGFNGRFLISAVPGDCPQQILQLQIESNSLVQIPTSTGVKTRDKSEGMKMPLSLATEIDTLELDDSTQVLHNSAENTKTRMSMVTQHVKPVSTQKPDCFVETFSSGNYNMKSTNASIPRLRTGQEHKASSTSCRLSRSTALSGEHEKRLFSVYSTIHHDAIKRGSPESKHWAQYLKVKGPGKIKACSVASRGDFKSVALTALSPSPKEQKTLCAESCSLDDSVKEKGSSKSEASARRSTWSGTRAEHKRRYRVGCKRKGSTSGACKQAGRERFHYKKGHRTSNAIQNPDNCHRKSNVPLSEPARVPNVLQEQDSTSRVACTRSTNGEDSNGKGNQSVEQGTLRTDDPFSLSAQLVLSADVGQLGDNLSTFTPEIAAVSVKSQQESSLNRQNSRACSKYQEYGVQGDRRDNASDSVASERQQDHVPQQRQTRKILHRSKTIGHSVGDHTTYESSSLQAGHSIALHGSCVSSMPDLISSLPAVCRDDCIKSREEQSKATHGQSQEPGALPGTEQLLPHNHIESLIHQPTLFKSHKKLSLEALRNQSHVEFSDTSSDDEDRLVIEI